MKTKKEQVDITDKLVSGLFAFVLCAVFIFVSFVSQNWVIGVFGTCVTMASTAAAHFIFRSAANDHGIVVHIPNNMTEEEFFEKYHVLEDMGKGLYRVAYELEKKETRSA